MSIENWIRKEYNRISNLKDEDERERLFEEFDEIIDKRNDLESYIYNYKKERHKEDMKKRGIEFENSNISSSDLKSKWEESFASGITNKDKEEIYFNDFMWHIFSYEKVASQKGSKARHIFNRIKKTNVYIFFENSDDVYYINNANMLKASDADWLEDVYIVDNDMNWTYVHTHESQCGPYFTRRYII